MTVMSEERACLLNVFLASLFGFSVAAGWTEPVLDWQMFFQEHFDLILTSWLVAYIIMPKRRFNSVELFIRTFSAIVGSNLIIASLAIYLQLSTRLTVPLIFLGGILSSLAATSGHVLIRKKMAALRGTLMVGYDPLLYRSVSEHWGPMVGLLGMDPADAPAGLPVLGGIDTFEQAVASCHPERVVFSSTRLARLVPPPALMQCRVSGIVVHDPLTSYEEIYHRTPCQRIDPAVFLVSPSLVASRRMMALQAVYTNVLGLFFLLLLTPLIVLLCLAIAAFCRPGPIFESFECDGFQRIPFRLHRFRCRRYDGSGALTTIGQLITRLHLTNLPQLVNVVRGEMALFGPKPVRREFAERLSGLMPFYAYIQSVKPGILGWAQVHLNQKAAPNLLLRLEYDLYQVKESSPALDLQILLRSLFIRRAVITPEDLAQGAIDQDPAGR